MFPAWLAARGTTGHSDDAAALRQVRAFLEAHGASRFQSIGDESQVDAEDALLVINRVGFKRRNGEDVEYLILPEAWRNQVCAGFDAKHIAKLLAAAGYMRAASGRQTLQVRLPELGLTWVYAVSGRVMAGDEITKSKPV